MEGSIESLAADFIEDVVGSSTLKKNWEQLKASAESRDEAIINQIATYLAKQGEPVAFANDVYDRVESWAKMDRQWSSFFSRWKKSS